MNPLVPVAAFFLSGFGFSSMSETVAGLGAATGAGESGAEGEAADPSDLLFDPDSREDEDLAVAFFAAGVVPAGFGVVERGDRVAIQ